MCVCVFVNTHNLLSTRPDGSYVSPNSLALTLTGRASWISDMRVSSHKDLCYGSVTTLDCSVQNRFRAGDRHSTAPLHTREGFKAETN